MRVLHADWSIRLGENEFDRPQTFGGNAMQYMVSKTFRRATFEKLSNEC